MPKSFHWVVGWVLVIIYVILNLNVTMPNKTIQLHKINLQLGHNIVTLDALSIYIINLGYRGTNQNSQAQVFQ